MLGQDSTEAHAFLVALPSSSTSPLCLNNCGVWDPLSSKPDCGCRACAVLSYLYLYTTTYFFKHRPVCHDTIDGHTTPVSALISKVRYERASVAASERSCERASEGSWERAPERLRSLAAFIARTEATSIASFHRSQLRSRRSGFALSQLRSRRSDDRRAPPPLALTGELSRNVRTQVIGLGTSPIPHSLHLLSAANMSRGRNLLAKLLYDCAPPFLVRNIALAHPPALVAADHLGRTALFWATHSLCVNSRDPEHATKHAANLRLVSEMGRSWQRCELERAAHGCVVRGVCGGKDEELLKGLVRIRAEDPALLERLLSFLPEAPTAKLSTALSAAVSTAPGYWELYPDCADWEEEGGWEVEKGESSRSPTPRSREVTG
jgi:hypothetical protein